MTTAAAAAATHIYDCEIARALQEEMKKEAVRLAAGSSNNVKSRHLNIIIIIARERKSTVRRRVFTQVYSRRGLEGDGGEEADLKPFYRAITVRAQ